MAQLLGFVLVVLGIIAEILFIGVELNGGHIQPTGFGVAAMMIVYGQRLRRCAGKRDAM